MNVLALVRKEYTIDDKRIYLIGHSMGGGGTWHLGTKYADVWAGLAPIAPAAFGQPTGLDKLKNVPVIVVQGDNDTLVRPEGTRRWVEKLKELKVTARVPGDRRRRARRRHLEGDAADLRVLREAAEGKGEGGGQGKVRQREGGAGHPGDDRPARLRESRSKPAMVL